MSRSEQQRRRQKQLQLQLGHGRPSSPSSTFSAVWPEEEAGEDEVEMVVGVVAALPGWSD